MTGQEAQKSLEAIVDSVGMAELFLNLAAVCYGKADHLRTNWQDESAAKEWDKAGLAIDALTEKPWLRVVNHA